MPGVLEGLMKKAYIDYKTWWQTTQCPELPSLYFGSTKEQAFEQHVKNLGLYNLMEVLAYWE
jgi:hypothetical protein